jgi:short chain dehydrogenase
VAINAVAGRSSGLKNETQIAAFANRRALGARHPDLALESEKCLLIAAFCELSLCLYAPNYLRVKSPIVSGLHLKYSRFLVTRAGDRARSALRGVGCSLAQAAVPHHAIGWHKEHGAQQGERRMARELEGKVAVVTGAASGIGLASTEAMLAAGSRVVMVDRDEAALKALCNKHGDAVIPLVIDLLDPKDCATLLPRVLEKAGQLDILR